MLPINAPLYAALAKHRNGNPSSFHVPGHHGGHSLHYGATVTGDPTSGDDELLTSFLAVMEIDLTELSSTDDLHDPQASIMEAQQLAADCFGSEETLFLVGGSTSGNIGMLLAICDPGDLVIVQRNVHKSVINGLKLANATAVFLTPDYDTASSLATIPSMEQLKAAIDQYPEAKAVFLSNPNYYGMGVELSPYARLCHAQGIPLVVDEAHGAHYGFHPELPTSAVAAGADAVVQSAHKTLPALTMGAMLHLQGNRIDRTRVKQNLSMIQSSSPSFPIMASLDISRAMIDRSGALLFQNAINSVNEFKEWLCENSRMISVHEPEPNSRKRMQYDPLRVLLYDRTGRLNGYELQRELEQRGIWAEMSNAEFTLLIVGIGTGKEVMSRLKSAIVDLESSRETDSSCNQVDGANAGKFSSPVKQTNLFHEQQHMQGIQGLGSPVFFSRIPVNSDGKSIERIELSNAVGYPSAEMVIPYPPGIPLLYPGETVTELAVSEISRLAAAGARFQGADDESMSTISIIIEEKS